MSGCVAIAARFPDGEPAPTTEAQRPQPKVRRGLKWRVLGCLVDFPVGLTVEQITARLLPPLPPAGPLPTAAAWRERRALRAEREELRDKLAVKVSRAVRRLKVEGLVMPCGHPRLDPAELDQFRRHGWERFRRVEDIERGGCIVGRIRPPATEQERFRRAIVETLAAAPDGVPYRHLLEMTGGSSESGAETGNWRQAFQELVRDSTVIPARARRPTLKGLQALGRTHGPASA